MAAISIEVFDSKFTERAPLRLEDVPLDSTLSSLKLKVAAKRHLNANRISFRLEPRGKSLPDSETISGLKLPHSGAQLYFRDLGPQIAWKTVFFCEYAGPLLVYPLFYFFRPYIYGNAHLHRSIQPVVTIAFICHSLHYFKRLYETEFVHRFSNATMPLRNLFKNCTYYWGFSAFISYFINHPLYTPPMFGTVQIVLGLVGFIVCEIGNFSIHSLLRNLRPQGTKQRRIPFPNSNPLTKLFNLVSCPNYTYEVGSWISFTVLTQCLPVALFTFAGFFQMKIWAVGKHNAYKKEFASYPKGRTPIVPFLC